jgi:murein DD-endopeptidase MepM/ murein hydrolase activator NlpD
MHRAVAVVVAFGLLATPAPAGAETRAAPIVGPPALRSSTAPRPAANFRQAPTVSYAPPVSAPVIDGFRPPTTPYGPGNRGWEYAVSPGTAVLSAADGTVSFAGQVGPSQAVTVAHADGLRTSYSYLQRVAVLEGDVVRLGDVVGHSGPRLHFGVRRGEVYLDPAILFAEVPVVRTRARLVPLAGRPVTR